VTAITYRAATIEDAEALARLRHEMEVERHPDKVGLDREIFLAAHAKVTRDGMAREEMQAWIAEADGRPVACVILLAWRMHPNYFELSRRRGLVTGVYTQPAYRRRGIGRRLMEHLVDYARARGISRLILWASEMGAPMYAHLGFTQSRAMEFNLGGERRDSVQSR
jgi:GNAT superfamily N-acetyltransferase